jgi:hypothetical protein
MAFLLPENIPSRSGIPDRLRQTARALRDFTPDEVTVWLRETMAGLPYLIVLDPAAGILLLDAPSLSAKARRQRRRGRVFDSFDALSIPTHEMVVKAAELHRELDASAVADLPVKCALAVPDLDEIPLDRLGGADRSLPMLARSDLSKRRLMPAIRSVLGGGLPRPLGDERESRARAVVNPTIILPDRSTEQLPLFSEPTIAPEEIIRVMDRRQERLAEHLHWGYRVIRGVAGSGKTLILLSRSRYLHRHWPRLRILIVTFNRVLGRALEAWTSGSGDGRAADDALLVRNIDRLPFYVAQSFPGESLTDGGDTSANDARVEQAIAMAQHLPDERRFDAVMVDEAQDFDRMRLELSYRMLKSRRMDLTSTAHSPDSGGHFLRVYDSAQNVLRRSGSTWNPPGVSAQGRTDVLTVNYRNTREILEFAMNFLAGSRDWASTRVDIDDPASVIPPEATKRTGPLPRTTACRDLMGEADSIASRVRELLDSGVAAEDIVVLHGCFELEDHLTCSLSRRDVPCFLVRKDRDGAIGVRGKVRIATLTKMKGLEFRHVYICGVNQIRVPDVDEDDQPQAAKSQIYAAMTRAMDELEITMSGSGEIGSALQNAERLQRVR